MIETANIFVLLVNAFLPAWVFRQISGMRGKIGFLFKYSLFLFAGTYAFFALALTADWEFFYPYLFLIANGALALLFITFILFYKVKLDRL